MFDISLLNYHPMEKIDSPEGRFYLTPIGHLPSVTTVLSAYQDKRYLNQWREKIGDKAADKIVEQARKRGNAVHDLAEGYLLNVPDWDKDHFTTDKEMFGQIRPILDGNIKTVYATEIPLYSYKLKIAGTADAVVMWQGRKSILDFKTSRRPISETSDKLRFYKMQTVFYAMMVEEIYGIDCEYSHIVIMTDGEIPKVISFRNTAFRPVAEDLIRKITK